jgi:hypothetical protein
MRRHLVAIAAVTTLTACFGERATQQLEVGVGEGDAVVDSTFPAFAARQLGRLRAGTTLEQWMAASPRDTVVLGREAGSRADTLADPGFCARATLTQPLATGGAAVRHAYFYPPAPDPSTPLPAIGDRAQLLRTACSVGLVSTHFEAPTDSAADAAAAALGDSLARGTTSLLRPAGRSVVAVGWLPPYAPGRAEEPAAAAVTASAPAGEPDVPELRALAPGLACTAEAARFHAAVQAGEDLVRSTTDRALAARLHLALADTYADLIALSYPREGSTEADLDIPEPSGLRTRAAEHYRAALALEPRMPAARRAWGTAWRLLAGLVPERRAGC